MKARALLALLLLLATGAAACGGDDETATPAQRQSFEPPDVFFERLLGHELAGRFEKSWAMLHPGHQALVTRAKYAACSRDDFGPVELTAVETVDMYDQPIEIRDVPEKTSKAVTLKITLTTGGEVDASTHTFHAVRVADRWAWYFGNGVIDAYKRGVCP